MEVADDLRFCVDQVVACQPRLLAGNVAWRGRILETGGELEIAYGCVIRVERDRFAEIHMYETDDVNAMLDCFERLGRQP
jgi:hypothetical protein